MKSKPLTDIEMFDLLQILYPDTFQDDDEGWEKAMDFVENLSGVDNIADLLGRVVMCTMPLQSTINGELHHALGKITLFNNSSNMCAVVKRNCNK
jgi:hypothetical protein